MQFDVNSLLPVLPEASCKGLDPSIWFGPHICDRECDGPKGCYKAKSEQGRYARIQLAKLICGRCPEQVRCLEWALGTRQPYGVWGGATERDRNRMLAERAKVTGKKQARRTPINNKKRPRGL